MRPLVGLCIECAWFITPQGAFNSAEEMASLPLEAVCKSFCCSGGGGGCVGTVVVRRLCHSSHRRTVSLRCAGPCAPSGPASGRTSSHSEDRRTDARRGDSSANNTISTWLKCIITTSILCIHWDEKIATLHDD